MRIIRKLIFVITVLLFFLLGISLSDKQYLSESIVGISIASEDQLILSQICNLIERSGCTDITSLFVMLDDAEIDMEISLNKQYFDANCCDMGHIPDGVYDTIVIVPRENGCAERLFLVQLKSLNHRFGRMSAPISFNVQKCYLSFLSFIGKAEKIALDFIAQF